MTTHPTAKTSRGLRVLPPKKEQSISQEYSKLQKDSASIERWWTEPRWKYTKREYTGTYVLFSDNYCCLSIIIQCHPMISFHFCISIASDVAALRPSPEARSTPQRACNSSFSNTSSNKLYTLLRNLHGLGGYSHTFGALDPVQVIQMAPHLSSIYVSGWQCSSTASTTNEPGPDFADYPMNTVPNKVDHLVRAQLHHDRRQHNERSMALLNGEGDKLGPRVDYLVPVVADGDTGECSPLRVIVVCSIIYIFVY